MRQAEIAAWLTVRRLKKFNYNHQQLESHQHRLSDDSGNLPTRFNRGAHNKIIFEAINFHV
jgi:hypothetical protein